MKINKAKGQFRQGDVLLQPVAKMNGKELVKMNSRTLALGEATGHHHTFDDDNVTLFEEKANNNLSINDKVNVFVDVKGVPIQNIFNRLQGMGFSLDKKNNTYVNSKRNWTVEIPEDCSMAALLVHQEHEPEIIKAGLYERTIQREWNLGSSFRVQD